MYSAIVFIYFWKFWQNVAVPILTLSTSKDVVSDKDVAFGGLENEMLHFDSFLHKTEMFGRFSTGQKISVQSGL